MKLTRKGTWIFRVAIVALALSGAAAIWAVPKFLKRSVTVTSQVTAYLLDERGAVNGLLLASGDQLHFRSETGATVVQYINVGDEVTATGRAGKQSSYGREVRVEQISAKGHTIQEIAAPPPPPPHGPKKHHGPKDEDDVIQTAPPANETTAAPAAAPEVVQATGTVRTHLVNGPGDVDGAILSTGEQIRFSPKVGSLIIAAEQAGNSEIKVEGTGLRNERGTVIRPAAITVGSQTITLTQN